MNNGYLSLLQALDSLFPVGTFTLSNGLETYVQKNLVCNAPTLTEYLNAYIYTLPTNDLGFAAKAAMGEPWELLDEICTASKSPAELRNGSLKQCIRFIKAEKVLGEYSQLKSYSEKIDSGICSGCYPVALGLFIRDTGTDIVQGLEMYCYTLLSSAVNHAVKLVPLRQLDGQKCLAEAMKKIPETVQKAIETDTDDLGISGAGFDLRSMQHEKLYSRLYIS
ncbi:MAG: urease accessory protein UreF [Porcipelethomonas sp.]